MVWNIAWKRRAIQLLTKTARWGEKKGQCGESERERETDGSRKNLAGPSREYGKPKNVSRKGMRRTRSDGGQSRAGQRGNDRKSLNIPPARTGVTEARLKPTQKRHET